MKKCLNEVLKYGGPFSPRDLYPYQLALYQIDQMRKDGKFVGADGSVPEGQGIVMAHLNECHELVEMVRIHIYEFVGWNAYDPCSSRRIWKSPRRKMTMLRTMKTTNTTRMRPNPMRHSVAPWAVLLIC